MKLSTDFYLHNEFKAWKQKNYGIQKYYKNSINGL